MGTIQKDATEEVKAWSLKIRKRARELAHDLEHGYLELAEILYHVYDKTEDGDRRGPPLWKSWKFKSFGDYVDQELGFSLRKAQRLRLIWFRLEVELKNLDPDVKDRICKLGWSKVRELARVLTISNAEEWLQKAEQMSFVQLEDTIRKYVEDLKKARREAALQGADPKTVDPGVPEPEETEWLHFKLFPEQAQTVDQAMSRAADLSGKLEVDKKGHLLELICTDFVATNNFLSGGSTEEKLRYIAKVERLLGLKLIVADAEGKELLYGLETLKSLTKALREAAQDDGTTPRACA